MNTLKRLYQKTGWYAVFSFADESSKARTYMLEGTCLQAVINGLTTGVFYTGFLMCFGFNIVNISILTLLPNITSLFTLLTPYVLDRFPKRRAVVSIARLLYYGIRILGITLLPRVLIDPTARIIGLSCVIFVSNAINCLFGSYNPWHMSHITPEVRTGFLSAISFVSNLFSTVVALLTSLLTERLASDQQLEVFTFLRIVAFGVALLEVYTLQKPKEPQYLLSSRPSLLNIIKLPLKNKKFALTMLICFLYGLAASASGSLINTWQLQEVKAGYFYISLINALTPIFIILTSAFWGKFMRRLGNLKTLTIYCFALGVTCIGHSLVDQNNYLWMNTIVRLVQLSISVLGTYATGNLIYLNMPQEDQTCFISFHSIIGSIASFVSMSIGTWVVALMGDSSWTLLNHRFTSVPTLLLFQGFAIMLVGVFVMAVRKYTEPEGRNI